MNSKDELKLHKEIYNEALNEIQHKTQPNKPSFLNKFLKTSAVALFALSIPFLAGCNIDNQLDYKDIPNQNDEIKPTNNNFDISFKDNKLEYNFTIYKPTPCHSLEMDYNIQESYPSKINFKINQKDYDGICAQVIDIENIQGEIDIDHRPNVDIYFNDQLVYRKILE
jgi:hypothetical protein